MINPQQIQLLQQFWANQLQQIQEEQVDPKDHQLPLARVKRVMKTDEDIRGKMMISSETPALLSKACEIFILELTMRAWMQTEENKRRTLGRADIAGAISKNDMYDFLIDLVPRDETRAKQRDAPQPDAMANANYEQYYQHFMSQYPAISNADAGTAFQQQQNPMPDQSSSGQQ